MSLTLEQFQAATARDEYNIVKIVLYLKSRVAAPPDLGIICGSGLSELHQILEDTTTVPYEEIPGFPQSTVQGHFGELVFGRIGAVSVVLMRGRFHFYEGYEPAKVAMPVRVMAALGVRAVIVTNASGGVNPAFEIGDFMVIQDHLSFPTLSGTSPMVRPAAGRSGTVLPPLPSPLLLPRRSHRLTCAVCVCSCAVCPPARVPCVNPALRCTVRDRVRVCA